MSFQRRSGAGVLAPTYLASGNNSGKSGVTGNVPITFRSASSNATGTPATATGAVNVPTGVQSGDLLVTFCWCYVGGSTPTITPPTGFTLVGTLTETDAASCLSVYSKTAGASEGSTYTFSSSPNSLFSMAVTAWKNPKTGTDGGALTALSSQTTWTSTAFTAGHAGDNVILCEVGNNVSTGAGPAGSTLVTSASEGAVPTGIWVYTVVAATTSVAAYSGSTGGAARTGVAAVAVN